MTGRRADHDPGWPGPGRPPTWRWSGRRETRASANPRPGRRHGAFQAAVAGRGRPLMRGVPIGLDSACRRGMANGGITVPRVAQEAVVNGYACHFARQCRSPRQARAPAVSYACRNGLTGPRITVPSLAADWIDPRRRRPSASLVHACKRMPYGDLEAAACTWTVEACVAAEAIAGLARTGPANPSDRMAEIKIARTVHMIPPWPFPRPAARGATLPTCPAVLCHAELVPGSPLLYAPWWTII
jgi:hypothetical protein